MKVKLKSRLKLGECGSGCRDARLKRAKWVAGAPGSCVRSSIDNDSAGVFAVLVGGAV